MARIRVRLNALGTTDGKITMKPKLKLRGRIYLGFGAIVLLLALTGWFGWLGVRALKSSFVEYGSVEAAHTRVARIDRDVLELQHRVNQYITTGHATYRDAARSLVEDLSSQISEQKKQADSEEMTRRLGLMTTHLEGYRRTFDLVVEERALRQSLVHQRLPEQGAQVAANLNQISASDTAGRLRLVSARSHFSDAQRGFLRYFEEPNSVFVNEALGSLAAAQQDLQELDAATVSASVREVTAGLGEFRQIGLRAVQATRGYLYLVSVVMAGEASEFAYHSGRLKRLTEARLREISDETAAASQDANRKIGLAILAAILGACLLAAGLAVSIIRPITQMTDTFRQLASGHTELTVPGADRADEIGDMASSAEVFRRQNARTAELLEQARKLSEELQVKAEELMRSNDELDRFAYVASHDLKSPLRGIHQLADWIYEDAIDALPEESAEHLQKLRQRVRKMETLLQDLLDYSRVGRKEEAPQEINLNELIDELIDLVDNPKQVRFIKPDDLPTLVTARAPLQQVFLNLLTNAVKHHHREKDGTIEISWRKTGDLVEFSVQDDGPGIAEENHARIFEMYQRVGDATVEGSGMGLAIVKKQVQARNGEISLSSALGEGTRFTFSWPANEAGDDNNAAR